MGLSSSQARLLHLTSRMHQIEYKAAKLEAEKLQMANESAQVYDEYLNALEKTKIQGKQLTTDGSITYTDITYQKMLENGYFIEFASTGEMWGKNGRIETGKITITQEDKDVFAYVNGNREYFIALQSGRITKTNNQAPDGYYEIYTAAHLNTMTSGNNYRLMCNIDMSGQTFSSKVLSSGKTFDGNGYSITGLDKALFTTVSGTVQNVNVQGNTTSSRALVANTVNSGATLKNITVSGSVNSNSNNVGALAGTVSGSNITIENCSANASVSTSGSKVGTLIGYIYGTSTPKIITNCSASGSVKGKQNVGGLIGMAESATITNSTTQANVTQVGAESADGIAGGFIGATGANAIVSNSSSYGDVSGDTAVIGGFVGHAMRGSTISNCDAYGDAVGNASNLLASNKNPNVAAFVSAVNGGVIKNCNAYGTASTPYPTSLNGVNAFANCNMSGTNNIGEVIDCYAADTSIKFSYNDVVSTKLITLSQSSTPNNNVINVTAPTIETTTTLPDPDNYGYMFDMIAAGNFVIGDGTADPTNNHADDATWFTNMYLAGEIFIYEQDKDDSLKYVQTSVATNTNLQEVSDESLVKKAETKYEADMLKIDRKDRKYDSDLAALDTERNAIKQEMETIKSVAKENVERTFKLFS